MDNRASENAEWDEALLGLELGDLQGDGFDLALTGFDDDELNRLLAALGDADGAREGKDEIPETPADPVSRPDDLWLLGPHRLLCGDSTVATDVERVLGSVTPMLMVPIHRMVWSTIPAGGTRQALLRPAGPARC